VASAWSSDTGWSPSEPWKVTAKPPEIALTDTLPGPIPASASRAVCTVLALAK